MPTLTRALLVAALLLPFGVRAADDPQAEARKEALQTLNDFIGQWKGSGGPDKPRPAPTDPTWSETIQWSWRFKGEDVWLNFEVQGGKHLQSGAVRFVPDRKVYRLTAETVKKQAIEFEGVLDSKGYLVFERVDSATGETQQLTMNSAAEGVRFVYRYATKPRGSTLFAKQFLVAATREGESLGTAAKKNECVVTGGLGTMTVSFMGETFYVCCTGCRDAFNDDPAKVIREFRAKKKSP